MKKSFFATIFAILALVVGAAGQVPAAHAADCTVENQACTAPGGAPGKCVSDDSGGLTCTLAVGTTYTVDPNSGNASKISTDYPGDKTDAAYNTIMIKIMSLFAWLLGVAALTLDYAVYYTVVVMGKFIGSLSAVGVTWRILRDIGNILLIFGFLSAGITTILNVNWYGFTSKMLPMLLVAAVFLNFSLFITEAVIDTGNLFATQFYKQINGGDLPVVNQIGLTNSTGANLSVSNEGISNAIMGKLGLQTIYGDALDSNKAKDLFKGANPWFVGFMGILLFIVAAFVMFSLAFILIARFVILLFLIIVAPIGFAGLAIPKLSSLAGKWWSALAEQTITAPLLLLTLYIALAVIIDPLFLTVSGGGGEPNWTGTMTGDLVGFGSVFLSFLVAMGLLLAVTIFSKKLSAFGASTVSKFGNSLTSGATKFAMGSVKFAGRTAAGAGRYTMRQTAGRAAHVASQAVMRSDFGQTQAGRLIATGLGKGGAGFKEAKEKSVKAHEAYVKSVGAAIEEERLPAIVAAQQKREATETAVLPAVKAAVSERAAASQEAKALAKEVERLEKVVAANEASGNRFSPQQDAALKDLERAKAGLSTANTKVEAADAKSKMANAPLAAAQAAEEKATKDLATTKREAAIAYGENTRTALRENPLTWAMTGTGGFVAGNEIIKNALKKMSDNEKLLDSLKKSIAKEIKESGSSAETSAKLNEAKKELTEKTEAEAKPSAT